MKMRQKQTNLVAEAKDKAHQEEMLTDFQKFKAMLYQMLLLLWDGIGFFTYIDYKLDRLKGQDVTFVTKLKNKPYVISRVAVLVIAAYIILSEYGKLGEIKSQTIEIITDSEYTFNITEYFKMINICVFWQDELIP